MGDTADLASYSLASALNRHSVLSPATLIALTTDISATDRGHALAAGFERYLMFLSSKLRWRGFCCRVGAMQILCAAAAAPLTIFTTEIADDWSPPGADRPVNAIPPRLDYGSTKDQARSTEEDSPEEFTDLVG